jgi:hypothetical protein
MHFGRTSKSAGISFPFYPCNINYIQIIDMPVLELVRIIQLQHSLLAIHTACPNLRSHSFKPIKLNTPHIVGATGSFRPLS